MVLLSQGHKPPRPESRPIQDVHWALIKWCWSTIDMRPTVVDVVSSLRDSLRSYPILQPLCDFLGHTQPAFSRVSSSHAMMREPESNVDRYKETMPSMIYGRGY